MRVRGGFQYVLTKGKLKFLLTHGKGLCDSCGMPLEVDDEVLSRNASRHRQSKQHHKACWDKHFIGVDRSGRKKCRHCGSENILVSKGHADYCFDCKKVNQHTREKRN
jgi:hypothetical protein